MFRQSKGTRRPSHSSSSTSAATTQPSQTWPAVSFLFVVNALPVNSDPDNGGVPPLTNEHGLWSPPTERAGFGSQIPGRLYRWRDGVVTAAGPDYQLYEGNWWRTGPVPLTPYRSATTFYSNQWTQFLTVDGDPSLADMARAYFPGVRWSPLTFRHEGGLSRLDFLCEEYTLAGRDAGRWGNQLGLTNYINANAGTELPESEGLSGNLAILISLIAFSCRNRDDLDNALLVESTWQSYQWRGHRRHNGRREERGIVVSIYLDPDNEQGSTSNTLYSLEWTSASILR